MTQPTKSVRRRPNAEYRWTRAKAVAFITALAGHGSVAAAARSVGMSRNSAYRLRNRLGAGFAGVWDDALALAVRRPEPPPLPPRFAQGDRADTR